MPEVSVIIPTYNRASFLKEAIESVLNQEYSDFELIIIDDGSTDNTKEIIKQYEGKLKYYYQSHKGVSPARNAGLKLARGDFIAFLDSDDLWKKEKLKIQVEFMKSHPEIMVCYTEEIWIRKGVRVNPKKKHKKYSGWIFDKVVPICLLSLSSALFRKKLFEEVGVFDENLPACEDYDLGLRIACKYPIHLIKEPLIIKRGGHPDQLSKKYWGMDRFRIMALEKILKENLRKEWRELVIKEIIKKCTILANGCLKRNKKEEAEKYFKKIDIYTKFLNQS
ncbi:glycosyltransferase [Candidatus Aminicenantes bacterium AC-708-M15]|jgi:glycosyltransferase involved in cell wall biosynthesis|nr:glycosyltransferase [SCandidatus Aminicenantes bacterium Aminicenantia_JdfR_composite]MCP2596902.1 glycosyltransferase [Candidatus Aminicenantes bacterium AC-335-G13]MCP2598771.1 glycosyltransferase [Candidatus Aminicenantes bacterium AC-335-L06]MCP2604216.1 glycosyltransferase [Candidatus Aminicenantes bacterium AC-708-M15]MCP2619056.1 glycosyltransferase [Candidatus Aminicenantes bacterium AC-335-A11]